MIEAETGREALELFKGSSFDLVIADCVMPEMSGCELAINVRGLAPEQPFILMSGWARWLTGWEKEADALMEKPFLWADLRSAIARIVSSREKSD